MARAEGTNRTKRLPFGAFGTGRIAGGTCTGTARCRSIGRGGPMDDARGSNRGVSRELPFAFLFCLCRRVGSICIASCWVSIRPIRAPILRSRRSFPFSRSFCRCASQSSSFATFVSCRAFFVGVGSCRARVLDVLLCDTSREEMGWGLVSSASAFVHCSGTWSRPNVGARVPMLADTSFLPPQLSLSLFFFLFAAPLPRSRLPLGSLSLG